MRPDKSRDNINKTMTTDSRTQWVRGSRRFSRRLMRLADRFG
jgi:hypothetical protein